MRRLLAIVVALACIGQGITQDKNDALPPRFGALAKNERFRLLRVLGTPELPATYHQAAAISTDGKRGVFAEDLSIRTAEELRLRTRLHVWDLSVKNWAREIEIEGKSVEALALAADGSKVLLAGHAVVAPDKKENNTRLYLSLWDVAASKAIHTVVLGKDDLPFIRIALAPDETTALTSYSDKATKLTRWDLKKAKELAVYKTDGDPACTSLSYLPGAKQFLAAYETGDVCLWDLDGAQPKRIYPKGKEDSSIPELAVARDGKHFARYLWPGVSLWDIQTGKPINTLVSNKKPLEENLTALALADDGKTVLMLWEKFNPALDDFLCARLVAWDGEANKILWSRTVSYRGRPPLLVQGDKLLIGGGPNLFEVWNIKNGTLLESWGGHKGTVNAIAALPNGDLLSAGHEGIVMAWRQGQVVSKRLAHAGTISAIALSHDRKQWLSAGADHFVKVWNTGSDKPIHEFKGHSAGVTSHAFSNTDRWACSGSADRSVKTWDLTAGKLIATLAGHSEGINAVAISPDERWIASGSDDTTIRVWPVKDGKLDADRDVIVLEDHKKPVTCLTFSKDGKSLISGSQDQTLMIWDWVKGKRLRTLIGHKNWVTSITLLDDKSALTTSDDLTVCWWDVASGKELDRIDFGAVGDCPRCLTRMGDRIFVGTSSWMIFEFQMLPAGKTKSGAGSSN